MLQLAQATATLVNNGVKHKPHIVIATQDAISHAKVPMPAQPPENLDFKPENVAVVRKAMVAVTQEGTSARRIRRARATFPAARPARRRPWPSAQKEKYNAGKLEEHQRDHACTSPSRRPTTRRSPLPLIVENAGFGAASAAPIARRVFDYWLMGLYPSEEDLAAVKKGQAGPPIGKPRNAAEVAWPPVRGSGARCHPRRPRKLQVPVAATVKTASP